MEYSHFEDTGIFYASAEMMVGQHVMSMNSGLIYNISERGNAKIIEKAGDDFFEAAQNDITSDGPCFFCKGSICREKIANILIWEL